MADLPQVNPTLDKMSARLGYAGSGELSPILKGLSVKFTFHVDFEAGERFDRYISDGHPIKTGEVKCYDANMTESTAKEWSMQIHRIDTDGTHHLDPNATTPLDFVDTNSRDMEARVTMGDPDLMFSGPYPTRNILQWTSNFGTCRRQFWVVDLPTTGAIYIDNQNAQGTSLDEEGAPYTNVAYIHVDPSKALNEETHLSIPTGETMPSLYWDRNVMFSINLFPDIGDEIFQQQESFIPEDQPGASRLHRGWGNRYANTFRNWGGVSTVEMLLGREDDPEGNTDWPTAIGRTLIPQMNIEDIHGYFCGPITDEELGDYTLTFRFRSIAGSASYVALEANVEFRRFPCPEGLGPMN